MATDSLPAGPLRLQVHHPDRAHKDHAWAYIGEVLMDAQDGRDLLKDAEKADRSRLDAINESSSPEERHRIGVLERIAELQGLGYEFRIVQLVPDKVGKDDAGNPQAESHKVTEVKEKG